MSGVGILLIGLACWLLIRGGSQRVDWSRPEMRRGRCLGIIGAALNQFRSDHDGRLPSRLSELVPNYIAVTNAYCFFAEHRRAEAAAAQGMDSLATGIDQDGVFTYLGDTGHAQDLVLYERTTTGDVKWVRTLANDLGGVPRSREDLDDRLRLVGARPR